MPIDDHDFLTQLKDEPSAFRFAEQHLWPAGAVCPCCGEASKIGTLNGKATPIGTYKCYRCRRHFTVKRGTIFERSHIPLHKWLQALYLCKCGAEDIEAQRLSEILNVTFKTSALLKKRIAEAAALGTAAEGL